MNFREHYKIAAIYNQRAAELTNFRKNTYDNMNQTFTTAPGKNNLVKYILLTGLLAGTLDGITAMLVYNLGPNNMFRYIASAAFGREAAFTGSAMMVAWGILFHYFIALSWTALYFLIYPFIHRLASQKYLAAIIYGVFVWLMMNLVVLRFTKIPPGDFYWDRAVIGATILVFMIGLPVSFFAHRYYSRH